MAHERGNRGGVTISFFGTESELYLFWGFHSIQLNCRYIQNNGVQLLRRGGERGVRDCAETFFFSSSEKLVRSVARLSRMYSTLFFSSFSFSPTQKRDKQNEYYFQSKDGVFFCPASVSSFLNKKSFVLFCFFFFCDDQKIT